MQGGESISDIFVKEMFAPCRGILRVIDGNTPMEICAHVGNMVAVAAARRGYTLLVAKASHMLEFVMKKLEEAGSSLRVVYILSKENLLTNLRGVLGRWNTNM